MKVTIKGEVSSPLPDLGEAFTKALQFCGYDPSKHFINGATLYFNIYDAETKEMLQFEQDGEVVDALTWATPTARAKEQIKAAKRKGKAVRVE